ncbi:putative monogalactosyldiacylglycerol synthase 3, chloroplastic isoform X2 [Wolffia australiana]
MVVKLDTSRGGRTIREALLQSVLSHHHPGRRRKFSPAGKISVEDDIDDATPVADEEMMEEMVQIGAERTKNVLILMSDTGGGHRASAEAIRDAFRIEFGDEYRVFVKDVWKEHAGWPLNDMERSYKFMVKHVQLWKVAFHGTYPREVEEGLMKYRPDIIISVHPLMQHIPLLVLKWQRLHMNVVFVTVVTDLNTCHPTWFHRRVTRCYCPSMEVSQRAFAEGLNHSQLRVFGLPIRPSFCRPLPSKRELREELEMDLELPAVLLMGGGEGMGPVKKTAEALMEALFDLNLGRPIGQIVIICGRNQALVSALRSLSPKIPTIIRGFETQMEKWMDVCDCIITKAGPGTIAEALIKGLPIILNDFIPGQEVGNVPYVVDNGAGVFSESPAETAALVARWFGPAADEMRAMAQRARALAQPNAVYDIVRDIADLGRRRRPAARLPIAAAAQANTALTV